MNVYVVIATYNASTWLSKCLNSLLESTCRVNIVVVDNLSTDDTLSIIAGNFKSVIVIKNNKNLGFGKANNVGIKHALENAADYVFLLNQDAWVKPGTIMHLIQISIKHQEFYILSPLHLNGSETQLDLNFSRYASPDYCKQLFSDFVMKKDVLNEVYETKFVNAALWLLPNRCLTEIGGFDPIFPHYGEDDDFVNRIQYHGYKVGICPNVVGVHDRSQEPIDHSKLDKAKRYNWKKVVLLIMLKNINKSFLKEALRSYKIIIMDLFKDLVKFDFTGLALDFKVLYFITVTLNKIYKNRKISKNKMTAGMLGFAEVK